MTYISPAELLTKHPARSPATLHTDAGIYTQYSLHEAVHLLCPQVADARTRPIGRTKKPASQAGSELHEEDS